MQIYPKDLVEAGIYVSEADAIHNAMRSLWNAQPAIRIQFAIHRYQHENLSIAKAAQLAGISFDRMKEILAERDLLKLEPSQLAQALDDVASLEKMLS
ncbi:MAG: UPF0175 family protein [Anaerolineae bacterium]|nr:UPF0175 family protein [Anaerolineae bacterium]